MDEASLIATEHRRRAAMMRDDFDTLEALLTERFHYAHISGLVEDRDAYLARLRSGQVRCPHTSARDLKADLRGGYALLTGVSVIGYERADGGSRGEVETLFTAVWEPRAEGWRIAAYASTPLPPGC